MSLEKLASEIRAMAEAEAKSVTDRAGVEAMSIAKSADDEVSEYRELAIARAEKLSGQIAVESVAAARQRNQKSLLVARRNELDATWEKVVSQVGSADLKGRVKILKSLLKQAKAESADDMVLRPAAVDRKALTKESSGYKIGDDIDGFGGFVLESSDGSVIMDYRFEGRLREAWSASLGEVSGILFGE